MAASRARLNPRHQDMVREKIRSSHIINRLTDHVDGKVELSASQVTAALGLLKKCIPDLAAVDHTGEIQHSYVIGIPEAPSVEAWEQSRPALQ